MPAIAKKTSKGKKKGSKKSVLYIREDILKPYYLIREDRQFVKMLEGNTLPQGYFIKLGNAIDSIAKDIVLQNNSGNTLTLRKYIHELEAITNNILNIIKE